jgi:hypothetical protein
MMLTLEFAISLAIRQAMAGVEPESLSPVTMSVGQRIASRLN